jgi:phosphoglycolate phosphatase
MYSVFIFDLDGTLLDTLQDLAASVNYALNRHGLPQHSTDDIRRFVGNGVRRLMERAVPGGAQHPLFDAVFADFRHYYMQHSTDTTRPYDGIPELLRELKARGCRLAVVSNKMMAATQQLVARFFPEVDVAIGEHEAEGIRKKPAPDTVMEALRLLGISQTSDDFRLQTSDYRAQPSGIVYVGDSDVDVETARNSGLPCLSVLWGFRDRDFLAAHGATCFVERPSDILQYAVIHT